MRRNSNSSPLTSQVSSIINSSVGNLGPLISNPSDTNSPLFVMFASGLAELVSLAVLIPFLSTISNPEYIWRQEFQSSVFEIFDNRFKPANNTSYYFVCNISYFIYLY